MGKPAARVTDMHTCPMVTPGTPPVPHVGGPITGPGVPTVLIGGIPAAVLGDMCTCVGPPATIILGSTGVMIGGKPAARMGDPTAHGGVIAAGLPTVLIGEIIISSKKLIDKVDQWAELDKVQKIMDYVGVGLLGLGLLGLGVATIAAGPIAVFATGVASFSGAMGGAISITSASTHFGEALGRSMNGEDGVGRSVVDGLISVGGAVGLGSKPVAMAVGGMFTLVGGGVSFLSEDNNEERIREE